MFPSPMNPARMLPSRLYRPWELPSLVRGRRPSLQEFQDLLRGARDHRLLPPDDDRALHELGVLEEQRDHRFGRLVGVCIQLQGLEVLVL